MRILHIVPGLEEPTNGIAHAAKRIAVEQARFGHAAWCVEARGFTRTGLKDVDIAFVHSMWAPMTIKAAWRVWRAGVKLVRMPHGCMDPLKFRYHWAKKLLAIPFDWLMFRLAAACFVTCKAEARWMRHFNRRIITIPLGVDVESDDDGGATLQQDRKDNTTDRLRVLFVGRLHPLKGLDYLLETMVGVECSLDVIGYDEKGMMSYYTDKVRRLGLADRVRFRGVVGDAEKSTAFATCDVFCLPTLSENFGIVVGEALAHGAAVVTTDGAPVWAEMPKEVGWYLDHYVQASKSSKVEMLRTALQDAVANRATNSLPCSCQMRRDWVRQNFDWQTNMNRLCEELAAL